MRKKSFWGMAVLMFTLVWQPAALANEAKAQIAAVGTDPEIFLAGFPFFYSYETGQWISSEPGKVFTTGSQEADFELPFLKKSPEPIRYPRWALKQGWQGELVAAVEILPDGAVGRWQVMRSTGHRSLDDAAVKAMRSWRFEPARFHGKPVVSCIQIPVRFKVD